MCDPVFQPENFTSGSKWPLETCFRGPFFLGKGSIDIGKKYLPNANVWSPADTSMKAPCMSKEQYRDIHDIVSDQGLSLYM